MDAFIAKLRQKAENLPANQRALANRILMNYQAVAFSTVREVATSSGVSEATIVRFARSLGFDGYSSMQKEIRRAVREDLKGTDRFKLSYSRPTPRLDPLSPVIEKEMENVAHLQRTVDAAELKRAVRAIRKAAHIHVLGARSTASLAHHLWFGLDKIELPTTRTLQVSELTFEHIARAGSEALLIAIGFPRYLRDIVDVFELARSRSVRTLSITDSPSSPLRGDINLYTPAESASFVGFHCAPLILINALLHEVSLADRESTLASLERFEAIAAKRRYFVRANSAPARRAKT